MCSHTIHHLNEMCRVHEHAVQDADRNNGLSYNESGPVICNVRVFESAGQQKRRVSFNLTAFQGMFRSRTCIFRDGI